MKPEIKNIITERLHGVTKSLQKAARYVHEKIPAMEHINFQNKRFIQIFTIFPALLISFSLYIVSSSLVQQIRFTENELKGLDFILSFSPLVKHLENRQIYSHPYFLKLEKDNNQISNNDTIILNHLFSDIIKNKNATLFHSENDINTLRNHFENIINQSKTQKEQINFHTLLLEIKDLLGKVQNKSQLVLEYELKIYQHMVLAFNFIPYVNEQVNILSQIYGNFMIQNNAIQPLNSHLFKIIAPGFPMETKNSAKELIKIYKNISFRDLEIPHDKDDAADRDLLKDYLNRVVNLNSFIINGSANFHPELNFHQKAEYIIKEREAILNQGNIIQELFYSEIKTLLKSRLTRYYTMLSASTIAFLGGAISFIFLLISIYKSNKNIVESNNLLHAVINAIPARVYWKNKNLQYAGCNDTFAYDAGCSNPGQLVHKTEKELPREDNICNIIESDEQEIIKNGFSVLNKEESYISQNGEKTWLLLNKRPLIDPMHNVYGLLGTYTNITVKKNMEENLNSAYREIKKQSEKLSEQNEELSQYAYVVSHDLKSPLRAIHNYADFIYEDLNDTLTGDQKVYLEGMKKAVVQSEQLVNDLLELSQIGKKPSNIVSVHLGQLLKNITETIHIPENSTIIIDEKLPVIDTEPLMLRQILQNLITNGLKFNKSENKKVEIGCLEKSSDKYLIFVRDNGIGIEPKYHQQIFKVFQRLHTQKEYEGTGIGLAIVKKSIERIGGSLRIESAIDKGTTFFILLPEKMQSKE